VLYDNAFNPQDNPKDLQPELLKLLKSMRQTLVTEHDSLFVNIVDNLIQKVQLFGSYFATLDIRQDSRVLRDVFKYTTEKVYTGVPKNLCRNE
jgi:phosphoenolpyruvate carboxylase